MPFLPVDESEKKRWDFPKICRHPEHDPPGMIVLPEGLHVYQCPACGQKTMFRVNRPTCKV